MTLTQPSRLSSLALRLCRALLLSGPLWKNLCKLKILRLSLPVRLSGMMRRTSGIVGLLCSIDKIDNGRPTAFMGHHVKEEKDEVNYATIYPIDI